MFWILDEVWRTGDGIATVAATRIEADFIGISTNAPVQTFINVWKSQLKIIKVFLPILKDFVHYNLHRILVAVLIKPTWCLLHVQHDFSESVINYIARTKLRHFHSCV